MADFVIYDTPSALIFTDALNLAPVVDAAFMCVRAYEPLTGAEQRLIDLLQEAGVPVLGSVLSDVPASVVEGYHSYEHYYGPAAVAAALPPGDSGSTITLNPAAIHSPSLIDMADDSHGRKDDGPSII
jgi:hypothetical protein